MSSQMVAAVNEQSFFWAAYCVNKIYNKVEIKFDYLNLIREFHKNQDKVFREIIKMDRESRFADR